MPLGAKVSGVLVRVSEGTDADRTYFCTSNEGSDVVGTNGLTFGLLAASGNTSATSVGKAFRVAAPTAKGTTNVHANFAGNDASNNFPGAFTNPDVPRSLRVTFAASWDGGNVIVTGTDQFDATVSETFTSGPGTTVVGSKVFKTVTAATKGAVGADTAAASIGTGDKLGVVGNVQDAFGIMTVDGVAEAVTVDATYEGFTPTTVPNGSRNYVAVLNVLHTHTS